MEFRWNDWNIEHCTKHGCLIAEIEALLRHPPRGFPRKDAGGKFLVIGRGQGGRMIRVMCIRSPAPLVYPIHAMPLTTRRRRG